MTEPTAGPAPGAERPADNEIRRDNLRATGASGAEAEFIFNLITKLVELNLGWTGTQLWAIAEDALPLVREALAAAPPAPTDVESLAATFHEIYQQEAKRQGDVRHKDAYADLPDNVKEFDRVLARYVLANFGDRHASAERVRQLIAKWRESVQYCLKESDRFSDAQEDKRSERMLTRGRTIENCADELERALPSANKESAQ